MLVDPVKGTRVCLPPHRGLPAPPFADGRVDHRVVRAGAPRQVELHGLSIEVVPFPAPGLEEPPNPHGGPHELPVQLLAPGLEHLDEEDRVPSGEGSDPVEQLGVGDFVAVLDRAAPVQVQDGVTGHLVARVDREEEAAPARDLRGAHSSRLISFVAPSTGARFERGHRRHGPGSARPRRTLGMRPARAPCIGTRSRGPRTR